MSNKKGLTLIEVIVCIAIMGIVALLASTNVFGIFISSKEKYLLIEENEVLEASKNYIEDYCDNPIGDNKCILSYVETYSLNNDIKYICNKVLYDKDIIGKVYYDEKLCDGVVIYDKEGKNGKTYFFCADEVKGAAHLMEDYDEDVAVDLMNRCVTYTNSEVTVTYNYNEGTYTGNVSRDVVLGEPYGELPSPTKTGYEFDKWTCSDDELSEPIEIKKETIVTIDHNHTIDAQYIPNCYKIFYDEDTSGKIYESTDVTYGKFSSLHSDVNVTKTGYKLEGWYVDKEFKDKLSNNDGTILALDGYTEKISGEIVWKKDDNVTVYAKWEPIKYLVKFDSNGGEGTMTSQEFTYGIEQNLKSNTFTKNGYVFDGWKDVNGVAYGDKSSVKNLSKQNNGVITLYAQWKKAGLLCGSVITCNVNSSDLTKFSEYNTPLLYTGNCEYICDDEVSGTFRIKFLTSGTLSSNTTDDIDVFLVGGGGSGNDQGAGGGGGYTKTIKEIQLTSKQYSIDIGAGGVNSNGGTTKAFGYSANGGGKANGYTGGSGGSGGSAGTGAGSSPSKGGENGSNGANSSVACGVGNDYWFEPTSGGTGQGTTTSEFEESGTTIYSGGGSGYCKGYCYWFSTAEGTLGGGGGSNENGVTNTGGGGGANASGGSGIVVIRNRPKVSSEVISFSNISSNYKCEFNGSSISDNIYFTYTGKCEVLNDGGFNWKVRFLTSGTLKILKDLDVDVFLAGGGGGGSNCNYRIGGSGGGTITQRALKIKGTYNLVVGSGGTSGMNGTETSAFGFQALGGRAGGGSGGTVGSPSDKSYGNGGQYDLTGVSTCEFDEAIIENGKPVGCKKVGQTPTAYGAGGGSTSKSESCHWGNCNNPGGDYGGGLGGGGIDGYQQSGGSAIANTGSGGGGGTTVAGQEVCGDGGSGGSGVIVIRNSR